MKKLIIFLALAVAGFAQTPQNVQKGGSAGTNNLTGDFNVGTGRTVTVAIGGALTISSGATLNLPTGYINWSALTGTPTTLAGYGITDPIVLTSGSYADPAWITSLGASKLTGTVAAARLPAFTGDATSTIGTSALTLATVNSGPGTIGSGSAIPVITVNGKGLLTSTTTAALTPAWSNITGTPTTAAGYGIVGGANLDALAGTTSATDTVPYWTGSATASTAAFPSYGRSVVASTTALSARTTLSAQRGATVDVRDYGAVGNGSTDDTVAVQAAINAAGSWGTVVIAPSVNVKLTYTVLLQEGQTLNGGGTITYVPLAGTNSCAVSNDGTTTATLYNAASNITIENLTGTATSGGTIFGFCHADKCTIRHCRTTSVYWHLLDATGVRNLLAADNYVDNSVASNPNASAIEIDQCYSGSYAILTSAGVEVPANMDGTACQDVIVRNNFIRNPQGYGLHLHRGGLGGGAAHIGISFLGNICDGCLLGGVFSEPTTTSYDVLVNGNQFLNNINYGIYGNGGTLIRSTFSNNIVDGLSSAVQGIWIDLNSDGSSNGISVIANSVRGVGGNAIRLNYFTNFNVTGNRVYDISSGTSGARAISIANCYRGMVNANVIDGQSTNAGAFGIYFSGTSSPTLTNITVSNNTITNVGIGIYFIVNATDLTISNNTIDTTSSYGISLGVAGAETYTFSHVGVTGNNIQNTGFTPIRMDQGTQFEIANNVVGNTPDSSSTGTAIYVLNSTNGSVSGNTLYGKASAYSNATSGITLNQTVSTNTTTDVTIFGNNIQRFTNGIYGESNLQNCSFDSNTIYDVDSRAIYLSDGSGNKTAINCTVTDNTIRKCATSGIVIDNASYCTISTNSIQDPTHGGNGTTGRGIQITKAGTPNAGAYNVITGNTLDGGADDPSETSQFGIYSYTDFTAITGNTVSRFKTGITYSGTPVGCAVSGNIFNANGTNTTGLLTSLIGQSVSTYASGTNYVLTTSPAAVTMGTTSPALTIQSAGTYTLSGQVNLYYNGATFAANRTVQIKITRTNNTPGDIASAIVTPITDIVTTATGTWITVQIPAVSYTTTNNSDALAIYASVSTVPSAGTLEVAASGTFIRARRDY